MEASRGGIERAGGARDDGDASDMDEVFRALADPSRRSLLDSLNERNGQTLRELCAGLAMARQSVSKHLAVLEAANLVTTVRRGREKLHFLNAAPINAIADRWINHYDRQRADALADLKTALEHQPMTTTTTSDHDIEFVYTTYIRTTPGAALAGAHRSGVHPPLLGRRPDLGLERSASTIAWEFAGITMADAAADRARRRAAAPARVHVAHDHARVRRPPSTVQRRGGRGDGGRAAFARHVRPRTDRRRWSSSRSPTPASSRAAPSSPASATAGRRSSPA